MTALLDRGGTVLVDDRARDAGSGRTYVFADPEYVLTADTVEAVEPAVEAIDGLLDRGLYVAGFVGYEAGLVLAGLPGAAVRGSTWAAPMTPLLWLGAYRDVIVSCADEVDLGPMGAVDDLEGFEAAIDAEEYRAAVGRIREYIAAGDVYQVNFTYRLRFRNRGSARAMFSRLRHAHPVPHAAFVNLGLSQIASLSPELFLRRDGDRVLTRPMKGTAPRGRWAAEDVAQAQELAADVKNRAENVMIVDLMRNDVGRVCRTGSVRVPALFHVGHYGSVLQMTSDVTGDLREDLSTADLLRAVLPPGSVTGAPKRRAMERIHELEREPRGPYCGAIGFFAPDRRALLNVAIRTVVQRDGRCELGIGGGIVFDSRESAELAESRLKAAFLQAAPREFVLRETLRFERAGGFPLLQHHLRRLADSASYFDLPLDMDRARAALDEAAEAVLAASHASDPDATVPGPESRAATCVARLQKASAAAGAREAARVALSLDRRGTVSVEWAWLEENPALVRLLLADERVGSHDVFLFHKTSPRGLYDRGVQAAVARGYFDMLYLNERGEVAEGGRSSIAVKLDGRWVTPPLASGLLPGIWRARLIEAGGAAEAVLTLEDLWRAEQVVVGNAVRGTLEVERIDPGAEDGAPLFVRPDDGSGAGTCSS